MAVESNSFLQLDYHSLAKVVSSSNLNVTSELQVFDAAANWLRHSFKKRSQFAKSLMLKIRFGAMSHRSTKRILSKTPKLAATIGEILKDDFLKGKSHPMVSRWCNQSDFGILLCGGADMKKLKCVKRAHRIDRNGEIADLPEMPRVRENGQIVCLRGEIYALGGLNAEERPEMSVEKYSPELGRWRFVCRARDKRDRFCACAFTGSIFVIGGRWRKDAQNFCLRFDPKKRWKRWKRTEQMIGARCSAACAVYRGKIVVAGGENDVALLNSVESFDRDKWSAMPAMIGERSYHSLVANGRKLFAVGGLGYIGFPAPEVEVFDGTVFVAVKNCNFRLYGDACNCVLVAGELLVFRDMKQSFLRYDVDKDVWTEVECKMPKNLSRFAVAKLPFY